MGRYWPVPGFELMNILQGELGIGILLPLFWISITSTGTIRSSRGIWSTDIPFGLK